MRKMPERSSGAPSLFTIKAEAPHVLERQQQNAPNGFKPKQSCCMTLRVLVCVFTVALRNLSWSCGNLSMVKVGEKLGQRD